MKQNDTNLDQMPTLITSCFILQNISEIHGDHVNSHWYSENDDVQGLFSAADSTIGIRTATEGNSISVHQSFAHDPLRIG